MKRHKFEVGMEVTIYEGSYVESITTITGFDTNGCPQTKTGRRGIAHENTWSKTGIGPRDDRYSGRRYLRPTTEEDRQAIQKRSLVSFLRKVDWEKLSLELLTQIAIFVPPEKPE